MKFLFYFLFIIPSAFAEVIPHAVGVAADMPSGANIESGVSGNCTGTNANVCSGQYQPVSQTGTTCTAITFGTGVQRWSYARTGNLVMVSGVVAATCTAGQIINFNLPIAPSGNFTGVNQLAGTSDSDAACWGTIFANTSSVFGKYYASAGGCGAVNIMVVFSYTIF